MKLKKCPECNSYTLEEACKKCNCKTKEGHYKFIKRSVDKEKKEHT